MLASVVGLGEAVREYRNVTGLSRDALASKLGVSRESIIRWERAVPKHTRTTRSTLRVQEAFLRKFETLYRSRFKKEAPIQTV